MATFVLLIQKCEQTLSEPPAMMTDSTKLDDKTLCNQISLFVFHVQTFVLNFDSLSFFSLFQYMVTGRSLHWSECSRPHFWWPRKTNMRTPFKFDDHFLNHQNWNCEFTSPQALGPRRCCPAWTNRAPNFFNFLFCVFNKMVDKICINYDYNSKHFS